jgi:hypothetical protein
MIITIKMNILFPKKRKMKKIPYLFIGISLVFLLSSCAIPHYQHTYESTKGLDLRKGKWLVNTIDSDMSLRGQDALAMRLVKELNKLGDISVVYIDSVSLDYLLPGQMQFELMPEALIKLKSTTDFDFIVNVRADRQIDQMSSSIAPPNSSSYKNQSEVYIDVYEIASGERVYSQRIVASIGSYEGDSQMHFTKSATGLIFGALKKGIKEIKRYSINY